MQLYHGTSVFYYPCSKILCVRLWLPACEQQAAATWQNSAALYSFQLDPKATPPIHASLILDFMPVCGFTFCITGSDCPTTLPPTTIVIKCQIRFYNLGFKGQLSSVRHQKRFQSILPPEEGLKWSECWELPVL